MRGYIFTKKERELILKWLRDEKPDEATYKLLERIEEHHRQIIFDFKLMLKALTKRGSEKWRLSSLYVRLLSMFLKSEEKYTSG